MKIKLAVGCQIMERERRPVPRFLLRFPVTCVRPYTGVHPAGATRLYFFKKRTCNGPLPATFPRSTIEGRFALWDEPAFFFGGRGVHGPLLIFRTGRPTRALPIRLRAPGIARNRCCRRGAGYPYSGWSPDQK